MSHGKSWTKEDDDLIRATWPTEVPAWKVASDLDRSVVAVYSRARALGLSHKAAPLAASKQRSAPGPSVRVQYIAPKENRDDDHVAACMAQGGFVTREKRGTTMCDIYPDGRVVILWQVGRAA